MDNIKVAVAHRCAPTFSYKGVIHQDKADRHNSRFTARIRAMA